MCSVLFVFMSQSLAQNSFPLFSPNESQAKRLWSEWTFSPHKQKGASRGCEGSAASNKLLEQKKMYPPIQGSSLPPLRFVCTLNGGIDKTLCALVKAGQLVLMYGKESSGNLITAGEERFSRLSPIWRRGLRTRFLLRESFYKKKD